MILGGAARNSDPLALERLKGAMSLFEQLPTESQVRSVGLVVNTLIDMGGNPIWQLIARSVHIVIDQQMERLLVPEDEWHHVVTTIRRLAAAVLEQDPERAAALGRAQANAWIRIAEKEQAELLDKQITWAV